MNANETRLNDETRLDQEEQDTNNQSVGAAANPAKQSAETNPTTLKGLGKKLAVAMAGVAGLGAGAVFSSFMPASGSTGEAATPVAPAPAAPAGATATSNPVSEPQHSGGAQAPAAEPVAENPDAGTDTDEPAVVSDEPVIDTEIHIGTPSQIEVDGGLFNVVPVYSGDDHELHSAFVDTDGDGLYDAIVDLDGNLYASADFSFGEIVNEFEGTSLEDYELNTATDFNLNDEEEVILAGEPAPVDVENQAELVSEEDVVAPLEVHHGNVEGYDVAYVPTVVEGQEAVFIDGVHTDENGDFVPENADGVFDVVVVEDGVYDIHEEGIILDDIQQHADPVPDFNPVDEVQNTDYSIDFDNSADVNNFI